MTHQNIMRLTLGKQVPKPVGLSAEIEAQGGIKMQSEQLDKFGLGLELVRNT